MEPHEPGLYDRRADLDDLELTAAGERRRRLTLACAAAVVLAGSLALSLGAGATGRSSHARVDQNRAARLSTRLATRIESTIDRHSASEAVQRFEAAHHEVADPNDPPPAARRSAIVGVDGLVRRWLVGYLPYEVDAGGAAGHAARGRLAATSTAGLARELISEPPLIPPAQHRPSEGRVVDLVTTIANSGTVAHVYVEIANGLDQAGLHLSLIRRDGRWLVAALAG